MRAGCGERDAASWAAGSHARTHARTHTHAHAHSRVSERAAVYIYGAMVSATLLREGETVGKPGIAGAGRTRMGCRR